MTPPSVTDIAAERSALRLSSSRTIEDPVTARAFEPSFWPRIRLIMDAIVLVLAAVAAVFAASSSQDAWRVRLIAAIYAVLVLVVLHMRGNHPNDRISASLVEALAQILGVVSLCAMLVVALASIIGVAHPVDMPLRLWLFSLVYLGVARTALRGLRMHLLRGGKVGTPTLVVGAGLVGAHIARRLLENPFYGLHPVALLDSDPLATSDEAPPVPLLDSSIDLVKAVADTGTKQVIVAFSSEPDQTLVESLETCRRHGIEIALVPRMFELINERSTLDHVGGVPLLSLRPTNPHGWQFTVKHAIDGAVAAIALLLLSPLFAAVAAAIKLTSPGPVFFRQRRVGRDGREFELLKFRSMTFAPPEAKDFEPEAGLAPGGVEGVDRRTALGRVLRRSSLDELPQLINVLRGDMSIVGPRPERPEFVEMFAQEVDRYDSRHRVKSGITGWAQVRGLRGQTSIADRVEWDNFYIQNWSLRLDLRIVLLTMVEVFRFRG